jgi:hypothetical protein
MSKASRQRAIDAIWKLDEAESVSELMKWFRVKASARRQARLGVG